MRLSLMSNWSSLIHKGLRVGVIQFKAVATILLLSNNIFFANKNRRIGLDLMRNVSASVESVHACGNVTLGLKLGQLFYFYERFWSEEETEY